MSILEVKNLSHGFGDRAIFENVSFRLLKGEHIGLVGANGEGKSTFMSIVTGKLQPDEGKVEWSKYVTAGYLDQHAVLEKGMTVRDVLRTAFDELFKTEERINEIYMSMADEGADVDALMEEVGELQDRLETRDFYTLDAKIDEVARALGVMDFGMDTDVTDLSGGQRTKILLAKLLLEKPDILLLDEPTNYLDAEHIAWLKRYLQEYENAFVLISHDIPFLNDVINIVYHVENQDLVRYAGDYDNFQSVYAMKKAQLEAAYERQQKEIADLQDFVNRNKARVATRNMAMSRQKKLDKMEIIELQAEKPKPEFHFKESRTPGRFIFQTKDLVIGYDRPLTKAPLNLTFERNQKVAIVGANGIGKTTLLKSLLGIIQPLEGEVETGDFIDLGYFEQEAEGSRQTPLEAVWDAFPALNQAEVRAALAKCGLTSKHIESQIQVLSGGEQAKVRFCLLMNRENNVLVLDEPTNHLDIETIAWLENYLVNYQGALIIVSHDRYFLDKVATVTLDLTKHSLDRYVGNYSKFMDLKAEKLATEAKNFEKQQKEIAKLEDFVNRNIVRASTTKRAQARRKQLEKMERLDKPTEGQKSANMTFHADKVSGNVVLTVRDAAIGYDDEILSEPISLDVKKMDAIAIVGPNGIGKTTFIKSVVGKLPFIKGTSTYGANVEVGYYDQTQSALTPSNTVLDELWNDFATTPEVEIRNRLGAFLFSGDDVKKSVSMLSGGEKARLLLAKLSMENNNFLILDEPTNHLDIDSKEVLENALIDFDGTLLFVSHDRYFINRVATQVLELSEEGSTLYLGDYDYYLEKKAELEALAAAQAEAVPVSSMEEVASNDYHLQKQNQKELRKITRRIEQLEAEMEELDQKIQDITETMHSTNDAADLVQLQSELDQLTVQQEAVMEEWAELSEQVE